MRVVYGKLFCEADGERMEPELPLLHIDPVTQPRHRMVVVGVAVQVVRCGRGAEPDAGLLREVEAARHHAHHLVRLALHADQLAYRGSDAAQLRIGKGLAYQRLMRRSEEHTSELQSHSDLVCRLLL